jgi:hypothetical protein
VVRKLEIVEYAEKKQAWVKIMSNN